jgi:integrase
MNHTPTQSGAVYRCDCGFHAVATSRGMHVIASGAGRDMHLAAIAAQRDQRAWVERTRVRLIHDLTDACKLPPVTTHMLRHTAGKFYTDLQAPTNITGAVLGHTPNITGHYAPPDADAMRPWTEQVYRSLSGEVDRQRKTGA